jgi:hypothetical protein
MELPGFERRGCAWRYGHVVAGCAFPGLEQGLFKDPARDFEPAFSDLIHYLRWNAQEVSGGHHYTCLNVPAVLQKFPWLSKALLACEACLLKALGPCIIQVELIKLWLSGVTQGGWVDRAGALPVAHNPPHAERGRACSQRSTTTARLAGGAWCRRGRVDGRWRCGSASTWAPTPSSSLRCRRCPASRTQRTSPWAPSSPAPRCAQPPGRGCRCARAPFPAGHPSSE